MVYSEAMSDDEQKTGLSRRTKLTIVVLLGFVLLGVAAGLVNQRLGDGYSLENIDKAAQEIVGADD